MVVDCVDTPTAPMPEPLFTLVAGHANLGRRSRRSRMSGWTGSGAGAVSLRGKLQALVYDILPSTTAVFSYAIGSRKLSANEQFFVGAQTVVSLLQTTQTKQGLSFIAANKVYTSTNKNTIVLIETELFFYPGWMRLMFTCVLGR